MGAIVSFVGVVMLAQNGFHQTVLIEAATGPVLANTAAISGFLLLEA